MKVRWQTPINSRTRGVADHTLLEKLLAQIEIALGYYSWEGGAGVARPEVLAGTIGWMHGQ